MNPGYATQSHRHANDSLYISPSNIFSSAPTAHQKSNLRAYMSASTDRMRPKHAAAGALNSKTLAEENLKGFRLRNL